MGGSERAATAAFEEARDFLLAQQGAYAEACAGFRWPELGEFNWALDWFDAIAAGNDRTALRIVDAAGGDERYGYAELSARSDRVAAWLRARGVARGDRVLVMLGNRVELWEALLACMKLGAVVVPTTTLLSTDELRDRIERGGVGHVVAEAAETPKFADVAGDWTRIAVGDATDGWLRFADAHDEAAPFEPDGVTRASDPLLLYFTSGTTSLPKLVTHTHASYPAGHLSTMYWIGLRPGDVHLNISSPGWAKHAWSNVFAPWNAEATVVVYRYERFDAGALLALLEREGVTSLCAPPTVWRMLIQADLGAKPGALRELVSAGEPLNPEVINAVRDAWGLTVRDGFGQTETTAQIGNVPGEEVREGSMGRPLPGYAVVLVDPVSGERGEEGEICLDLAQRPLGLMAGYAGGEEETAHAMRDGVYHTGDVAQRDADGYITFVGRADDVFKASDYRISPFELESVLLEHPAVAEVAVVPSPDPVRLAVPKAIVVLAAGWEPSNETAQAILAHGRAHLAPYKRVRRIEFAELPKTISGKIRRAELREREARLRPNGEPTVPGEWLEDRSLALS